MYYEPENLNSAVDDKTTRDPAHSARRRQGRQGRINLLDLMLRGKLRGISGLVLIFAGISAIALVVLLLVALIAFVVQRSGESANFVPTIAPAATQQERIPTATVLAVLSPTFTAATPVTPTAILSVTSTPVSPTEIHAGGYVAIEGTGSLGLRFRVAPGLESETADVYDEGTRFLVLEGPERVDEIDWWRLEGQDGITGWAAGDFLEPADGFGQD